MKRFAKAVAVMLFVGIAESAPAQDIQPYVGVGAGFFGLEYKEPGFSQKNTVFGGFVKVGADINEYVAAEVRLGGTMDGTQAYAAGTMGAVTPFELTLAGDFIFSYLLKLQFPVAGDFRVYGLAGGTTAKLSRKLNVPTVGVTLINDSATNTGVSYGLGADYFISDRLSASVEWVQYWTNVDVGAQMSAKMWSAVGMVSYHF